MLLSYLKRHYKIILLLVLFILLFGLVFYLYQISLEPILYASLLCFVVGLILFFIGYSRYVLRHRALQVVIQQALVSLDRLPLPKGLIEADYQRLLHILWEEKTRLAWEVDRERQSMVDYYTMWVHQIKTPIAALDLLLQGDNSADREEKATQLFQIRQYVDMVLQYLRLESDSSDLLLAPYSLDDLIRQAVRQYAPLFIRRRIRLDFQPTEMSLITDEKWMVFVIGQILSNALKYTTEQGQVCIYAEGRNLIIADTGIGIRPEDLPRIGEKGFTGYNGRSDKKSTGLGLYLCKRVLDRLGYGLHIYSAVDQGTEVHLHLFQGQRVRE